MDTNVRTPQDVFLQPQRLIVPLFQRPYVWNEEKQWEPLWDDVTRVATRLLAEGVARPQPHFLGAVVLQQVKNPTGHMQERTIIDGQQRLTTLQLLLDALHAELLAIDAIQNAKRIEPLVANADAFRERPEDRFKVWPTNRDRPVFNAVMAAEPPVGYDKLGFGGERILEAHRYFGRQAKEWLSKDDAPGVKSRADGLEMAARELLHMVVIDLHESENAQEIFETLNARGTPLTAADLIKNFVFQQLQRAGANVEHAYDKYWKDFETAFWEADVSVGRLRYPRSAIYLNHWLVAKTGDEVVATEVFTSFKNFADESAKPMVQLLEDVDASSRVYRKFIERSAGTGPVDRLDLFGYRTAALESEVVKPLVLYLLDPKESSIATEQVMRAIESVESWMVRRMLVRATTKSYTQVFAEIISELRRGDRSVAGDVIFGYFARQASSSRYWPDDEEIRTDLRTLQAYRRLSRARLRMVLEAIEDYLRGWKDGQVGLGGERVARGKFHIEHVLPRKWKEKDWPLPDAPNAEGNREQLIHAFGNLTLLTDRLNPKLSNGPWLGPEGKRQGLQAHDVLLLNRQLLEKGGENWTEAKIQARTDELAALILKIWPAPPGHHVSLAREEAPRGHHVDLLDLISAGYLTANQALYPRRRKYADVSATLLSDGRIDVAGKVYGTPSEAARAVTGLQTNGWWFFLISRDPKRELRDVRRDYRDVVADQVGTEEEEEADDEDDDNAD